MAHIVCSHSLGRSMKFPAWPFTRHAPRTRRVPVDVREDPGTRGPEIVFTGISQMTPVTMEVAGNTAKDKVEKPQKGRLNVAAAHAMGRASERQGWRTSGKNSVLRCVVRCALCVVRCALCVVGDET